VARISSQRFSGQRSTAHARMANTTMMIAIGGMMNSAPTITRMRMGIVATSDHASKRGHMLPPVLTSCTKPSSKRRAW
jgi:hypothetical protein